MKYITLLVFLIVGFLVMGSTSLAINIGRGPPHIKNISKSTGCQSCHIGISTGFVFRGDHLVLNWMNRGGFGMESDRCMWCHIVTDPIAKNPLIDSSAFACDGTILVTPDTFYVAQEDKGWDFYRTADTCGQSGCHQEFPFCCVPGPFPNCFG